MLASARGLLWTLAAVAVVACMGGCVERQMTIRSDPPGALVYVDDTEIGITPVSTPFTYYGQRKILLTKDGYEPLTVIQPVPPPLYDIPGVDFVPETLVAGKIRDERTFDYRLQPQMLTPPDQLRERAEGLRRGVQASATGPVSTAAPGMRINPPAEVVPAPAPAAPPAIGGQMVYPVQPGGR